MGLADLFNWFVKLESEYKISNICSIIGLPVSVLGFLFSINEIAKSKSIAAATKEAVEKAVTDMEKYSRVIDISRICTILEEIKRSHRNPNWHVLAERYSEIRKSLIALRESRIQISSEDETRLQKAIMFISDLQLEVDRFLLKKDKASSIDLVNANREVSIMIDHMITILEKQKL